MYVDADRLDEAMAVVYGGAKQRLISPVADNSKGIEAHALGLVKHV
jgi:hypothetical protein